MSEYGGIDNKRPQDGPSGKRLAAWRLGRSLKGTLILLAILGVAGAGYFVWNNFLRTTHFYVLNGLDFPVTVTVGPTGGGDTWQDTVPANGYIQRDMQGQLHVRVEKADGTLIEEQDVEVPKATDLVAYNVLGASPAILEEVIYSTDTTFGGPDVAWHDYCGQRLAVETKVDYAFVEPPDNVTLSGGSNQTSHWWFHFYSEVGQDSNASGNWNMCMSLLQTDATRTAEAQALASAVLAADPTNVQAQSYVSYLGAAPPTPPTSNPTTP